MARRTLQRVRRIALGAVAASGLIGSAGLLVAQQPPQAIRSTQDARPRLVDEHDRPYSGQAQSHRGFEVREAQFTVVATTSPGDARWAAGHVAAAWTNAAQLTRRWTPSADNADFGLGSLQVVIDNEPLRERDAPRATVNVVGIQTQVVIRAQPGQPPLVDQVVRLREAAALALLHTAGVDAAAPSWVVAGLAAHAGRQGLSEAQLKTAAADPLGGQQWRFARATQDQLAYQHVDHAAAASQIAFLLTANDAEHAPALFAALHEATVGAQATAASGGGFRNQPREPQLPPAGTSFDRLLAQHEPQFKAWQEDPLAGQPVVESVANLTPELSSPQAEMLVLLKLHRRLSSAAAKTTALPRWRIKIVSLQPTEDDATAAQTAPAVKSFGELAARLTDRSQPAWATLDVDGNVLLSSDTRRVNQLLANDPRRYTLKNTDRGAELVLQLAGGRELRGWLADNPKHKSRPLAKFDSVSKPRTRRR